MCSVREERLARLRAAIDEVALAAQAGAAGHADPGELAERLAGLWAMIVELDPGLAARLRGYCPDTSLRNRAPGFRGLGPPGPRAAPRATARTPAAPSSRSRPVPGITSRRSRLRSWRSPRGAAAPGPGAPRWS